MAKTANHFETSGSLNMKAFKNIAEAWREVTDNCMNGVWPECINDLVGFKSELTTHCTMKSQRRPMKWDSMKSTHEMWWSF